MCGGMCPAELGCGPPAEPTAVEARGHLSLAEVGTEEFLQKLTSQITEIVSAKITHGEGTTGCGARAGFPLSIHPGDSWGEPFLGVTCPASPSQAAGAGR